MRVDDATAPDPETINEFRKEARQALERMSQRDLLIEAATNAWVAVRVLYRIQDPRIRLLEARADSQQRTIVALGVILPILVTVVGFWVKVV